MVRVGLKQSEVVISEQELSCWVVWMDAVSLFCEPEVVRGYDRGHTSLSSCSFPVHSGGLSFKSSSFFFFPESLNHPQNKTTIVNEVF